MSAYPILEWLEARATVEMPTLEPGQKQVTVPIAHGREACIDFEADPPAVVVPDMAGEWTLPDFEELAEGLARVAVQAMSVAASQREGGEG